MKPLVKIPRPLLLRALADLERPHPFAAERLGFFSMRQSLHPRRPFLLCYDYHTIPDNQYIRDFSCGARINGDAIVAAMNRARRENAGQLWVHTHGRIGQPSGSSTDEYEGPRIVQSLVNAQNKLFQGWAVVSEEGIAGQCKALDGALHQLSELAVIGWPTVFPMIKSDRRTRTKRKVDRYARQGFLGERSQNIIGQAKIGIVGLGGGGSHINQQLAHIGFQHIVLCDVDRVELSNLNRLVGGTVQDVRKKRFKTHIASRGFWGVQPDAEINDEPKRWEEKRDLLRDCDLIFGSIDSFSGRRDLEAFCRSMMIPLIDVGMTALRHDGTPPEVRGQVIVSMPGESCMHCLQFLTEQNLAQEVQDYNAGPQPQVVWPNGVLASNAVGHAITLLTAWAGDSRPASRIDYRGSTGTINASNIAVGMAGHACKHYPLSQLGDPIFERM